MKEPEKVKGKEKKKLKFTQTEPVEEAKAEKKEVKERGVQTE